MQTTELTILVSDTIGPVSALLQEPATSDWLLVFGHGAGAGMRHAFMEGMSLRLAERSMATLRYQFPFVERGASAPDRPPVLLATVRAAAAKAAELSAGRRLLAGGKSMGGRVTSGAAAAGGLPGIEGIVFFGFPLHAAGRPSAERGAHLLDVGLPLLFLQGSRDAMADLSLLRPIVDTLGGTATLHVVEAADHGFHVPRRSGRDDGAVMDELADITLEWARAIPG